MKMLKTIAKIAYDASVIATCTFMPILCYAIGSAYHLSLGVLLGGVSGCICMVEFWRWIES
jgi:hypothetical protein